MALRKLDFSQMCIGRFRRTVNKVVKLQGLTLLVVQCI